MRLITGLGLLLCLPALAGTPLENPPIARSINGKLVLDVKAAPATYMIGSQKITSNLFTTQWNGQTFGANFTPPVWRLKPGEAIDLKFTNHMIAPGEPGTRGPTESVAPPDVPVVTRFLSPTIMLGVVSAEAIERSRREHRDTSHSGHLEAAPGAGPGYFTNMHWHGFAVSPRGNSDNVFIVIPQFGASQDYHVELGPNHASGLFWYHVHPHSISEQQVMGGLSGVIVVDGIEKNYPQLAKMRERIMLIKHLNGSDGAIVTLNGLTDATIDIRPGEQQFWRIVNAGADTYYRLAIAGAKAGDMTMFWTAPKFRVLAMDGNLLEKPTDEQTLLIAPGNRYDVVVTGPQTGYPLVFTDLGVKFLDGFPAPPPTVLATLLNPDDAMEGVTASTTAKKKAVPELLGASARPKGFEFIPPTPEQIRKGKVSRRCTWTFSENAPNYTEYYINKKRWEQNRIDTEAQMGTYEEWTIINDSPELHAFHIHQMDYLVTAIDGSPVNMNHTNDVVNIPLKKAGQTKPHSVTIKIPFVNPVIAGKFVFHCHVLLHEDLGMMANIEVVDRKPARNDACVDVTN